MRHYLSLVVATAVLVAGAPATAAGPCRSPKDEAAALTLASEAKTVLAEGRPVEAVPILRRAVERCPHPKVRFLLGKALVEADDGLDEALALFDGVASARELGPQYAGEVPGLRARAAERLRPAPLTVTVEEGAAEIRLDGAAVATGTWRGEVARGRHVVAVEGKGCHEEREVVAAPGEPLALTFRCAPPPGHIAVACPEPGMKVLLDGTPVGVTPLREALEATPGPHVVRFEKPGVVPCQRSVEVAPGLVAQVDVQPVRAAASEPPSPVWFWTTLGTGVALVGTGAGFLVQYGLDKSNARGETATHEADVVSDTNLIVGSVLTGVGVGLGVTSIFLWPDAPETSGTVVPRVTLVPTPGGGFAGAAFEF